MPERQFEGSHDHLNVLTGAVANGNAAAWNDWRRDNPDVAPNLRGLDMPGLSLPGADLSDANLFNANLQGARLDAVTLSGASLVYARLDGAQLTRAQILGADLEEASAVGANLAEAVLRRSSLVAANLTGACLRAADLGRIEGEDARFVAADLRDANLEKADLWMASFTDANLTRANLRDANLNQAGLEGADLTDADLIRVRMTGVNLCGATISGASIYGLSAWDVRTDEATLQRGLSIAPPGHSARITVDDVEVAQFVNMLVDHAKLRKVISTLANRAVLILGRFAEPERKHFLEELADAVRDRGLLPIIYDFERPPEQDWTETVLTLASVSLFVIADITRPSSVPLELQATVPSCMVPFVPLHQKGEPAFSMFKNLQAKHDWVLPVVRYTREKDLLGAFDDAILEPAAKMRRRLNERKAGSLVEVDLDAILSQRRQ
jgi:uncharacterized protein YjbI with pentapeptide repeats